MHFLRFGSSIPGEYWGCCCVCIIQNFKVDPDAKASIQLVGGDSGSALGDQFAGPTYRDIFHQRLRIGTHSNRDMPNHAFLAVITRNQLGTNFGKKWLAILKENGFEFIRAVSNSVGLGATVVEPGNFSDGSVNYLFGLFRNIGNGAVAHPLQPPAEWTDLPSYPGPEQWDLNVKWGTDLDQFVLDQQKAQRETWDKIGPAKFLTKEEVKKAGAPVILAGLRSENPQEPEERRLERQKARAVANKAAADAFPTKSKNPAAEGIDDPQITVNSDGVT